MAAVGRLVSSFILSVITDIWLLQMLWLGNVVMAPLEEREAVS